MSAAPSAAGRLPSIKFFKAAIDDIVNGAKTLEPRARSQRWIEQIQRASRVRLTWGPRCGPETTFAIARIVDVSIRGFATASRADVDRIGSDWVGQPVERFVAEYTTWYAPQLAKGHPVAWISFEVVRGRDR